MIDYEFDEVLVYAEAAFANKQFEEALKYYVLALQKEPDNLLALSRAGSICVVTGRYDDAFSFFSHAVEVAPDNGDNYYNLGNAYYFHKEYDKCLEMYAKAEMIGCSPEVERKMYFQKAMLCEQRGDLQAALLYMNKYEKAHSGDVKAMEPRVLAEKIKLHIALKDYESAEVCAAKLILIQPTVLNNYVVYFSMLMVQKKYEQAEDVLVKAEENAVFSEEDKYTIGTTKAAFYIELSEVFGDDNVELGSYTEQAEKIYEEMLANPELAGSKVDVKINLAHIHMKAARYDDAIALLDKLLPSVEIAHCKADLSPVAELLGGDVKDETKVWEDDADAVEVWEDDADTAEVWEDDAASSEYGEYVEEPEIYEDYTDSEYTDYNEDDVSQASEEETEEEEEETPEVEAETKEEISEDNLERIRYILMSCYVSKEDYPNALQMAECLKDSQNVYYQYFSRYCEAYAVRSLAGCAEGYTKEMGEQKYAEVIAFYRSRMMKNPKDKYAIVLRTRMYAEQGLYVKAEEMTKLLGERERDALSQYIEQCRTSAKNNQ